MRIIVAGGAGHIGRHLCAGFAEAGAEVLCLSSKEPSFPTKWGIDWRVCDLGNEPETEEYLAEFGDIDGFINCAGRAPRHADIGIDAAAYALAFQHTATIALKCARAAQRHMPDGGSYVTLASMWGQIAPSNEIYLGMKNDPSLAGSSAAGAVMALVKHLAVTMAPKVRVNALVPGWFPKRSGPDNPEYMAKIAERVPLARIGQPQELVGPAMFLLSKASSYVTGQCLFVDGGYSVR